MSVAILPLTSSSTQVRARLEPGHAIRREMDIEATCHALWLALRSADDAGLDRIADRIGQLHLEVVRVRRALDAQVSAVPVGHEAA